MQQYIKSVFVLTLVYEVKKEALFMGKSHENLHGGMITSLAWFIFGAIVAEMLHHLPTFMPSVAWRPWQHLISHLRGLYRQDLGKVTSVSWTCREAGRPLNLLWLLKQQVSEESSAVERRRLLACGFASSSCRRAVLTPGWRSHPHKFFYYNVLP